MNVLSAHSPPKVLQASDWIDALFFRDPCRRLLINYSFYISRSEGLDIECFATIFLYVTRVDGSPSQASDNFFFFLARGLPAS